MIETQGPRWPQPALRAARAKAAMAEAAERAAREARRQARAEALCETPLGAGYIEDPRDLSLSEYMKAMDDIEMAAMRLYEGVQDEWLKLESFDPWSKDWVRLLRAPSQSDAPSAPPEAEPRPEAGPEGQAGPGPQGPGGMSYKDAFDLWLVDD